MIIYIIIVLFFIYYGRKNYEKAFPIWIAFSIATHYGTCLKATPPALTVTIVLNLYFLTLFFFRCNFKKAFMRFPLKNEFLLVLISYFISSIFSRNPFSNTILNTIQVLINDYLIIIAIWFSIRKKYQLQLLIKSLGIIVIIATIYGIVAFITNSNPIIEFEMSLLPTELNKMSLADQTNRGLKAQSFFLSPTNFGAYIALFWLILTMLYSKYKHLFYISTRNYTIITGLIIVATTLIKTRSSIFSFFLILVLLMIKKKFWVSKYAFPLTIVTLLFIPFILENIAPYITSIFDSDSKEITGSSIDMRMNQLSIILDFFLQNPITGLGIGSMDFVRARNWDIYGAESIWFWLLLERGIIGTLSFIWIFISVIKKLSTTRTNLYLHLTTLYWIVLQTMTTTVGVSIFWYFLIIFLIVRGDRVLLNSYKVNKLDTIKRRNT